MEHVSVARLEEILRSVAHAEVAVVGDVMLDRYFWGSVTRVSPEAPVPVVDIADETFHLGGAANVAANIRNLGAKVVMFGVVGSDTSGEMLQSLAAKEKLDPAGLIVSASRPTTVKTRVIGNNQQLVRLDRENRTPVDRDVVDELIKGLSDRRSLNAIVVQDYDKGLLSPEMIAEVIKLATARNIPVYVDPKKPHLEAYRGCFLFKPNKKEASDALGTPLATSDEVHAAGTTLLNTLNAEHVLITLGSEGMMLFSRDGSVKSVPTVAKNVADVSGAGDTAIATLVSCMVGGASVTEAATLANIASGVVVAEPGIVAINTTSLTRAVKDHNSSTEQR